MKIRLGIDVACEAEHQASCADETGQLMWSGRRFRTTVTALEALWAQLPAADEVMVVLEPTRNAWVPLANWFRARGATVVLVPPEQSADLREYYHKHAKTDRLDSKVLARLPLLHPEGLRPLADPGPADPLRRAVRRRSSLVERRTASFARLDALLELLGPAWSDLLAGGGEYGITALTLLAQGLDPRRIRRLGVTRLASLLIRVSHGNWRRDKAEALLAAASETVTLWAGGGLDFTELAADLAGEARLAQHLNTEIGALDERINRLYREADPGAIIASGPGMGPVSAAGVLGRLGDPNRFANLAGVRSFTGLVPAVNDSGLSESRRGPTNAGDPGLRAALFLAADRARKVDPTLAARYYDLVVNKGRHHNSALCTLAAVLVTRLAACWRHGTPYQLRDTDGTPVTTDEGRKICAERYRVTAADRARTRRVKNATRLKTGTGRRNQESQSAPAVGPSKRQAKRPGAA